MRAFLQCVREAWKASRKSQRFFYNTLVVEDYGNKFRDLAASIIEEEDLATDLEDVILKVPSEPETKSLHCTVFIEQGLKV